MASRIQITIAIAMQHGQALRGFDQLAGRVTGLNGVMAGLGRTMLTVFGGFQLTRGSPHPRGDGVSGRMKRETRS